MKYKLIKEYPDSPKLGTIALPYRNSKDAIHHYVVEHTKKNCDYLAISKRSVEQYPEYWEEVNENLWWCVWIREYIQHDVVLFNAWTPYQIECIKGNDLNRHYFETKEEADKFILYNKPCLSAHDILCRFGYSREFGKNSIVFTGSEESLTEFINDTK